MSLYAAAAAMKTPAEIPALAAGRVISQPFNVQECPAVAEAPARPARR